MANKGKKKRKNSSEGDCAKTSKSNKEAKSGSPEAVSDSCLNSVQYLYSSPVLHGGIPVNMNSSFNGSVFGSPAGSAALLQNSQQLLNNAAQYPVHGMSSGMGHISPPGQYQGSVPVVSPMPPFNMASIINSQQQQPTQPVNSTQHLSSGSYNSNGELMRYLNSKFDEVNKRLDKLDLLEKRVNEIDGKVSKLWTDLDQRVTSNTDNVTRLGEKVDSTEFDLGKTREELETLRTQNQNLKDTLVDMQSKSMINHLIIGGLDEAENETAEVTEKAVRAFMYEDLKLAQEKVTEIKFDRVQRTGTRLQNRPRKILAVFSDTRDKTYVKSFRRNLETTNKFMHDQYPPEVVAYRKKLVPFLKLAKDDGKDAYIKYNKLIVDGRIYTDGAYGKVPE